MQCKGKNTKPGIKIFLIISNMNEVLILSDMCYINKGPKYIEKI